MSERIEGVPIGTKLARIGPAKQGEWVIGIYGKVTQNTIDSSYFYAVIEPDNCYGVIDLSNVPIPEGYERDGETPADWFREPKEGESAMTGVGEFTPVWRPYYVCGTDKRRIIVRKIAPKTTRFVVLETSDPKSVAYHEKQGQGGIWSIRFEDRAL